VENGYAWVHIPAWGAELKVILRRVHFSPGEKVVAGIRPEYIEHARAPGENIFPATILQVVESIASVTYRFLLMADTSGRHYLNATISRCETRCMTVGETCLLRLPPEQLILIGE
jgi:hypothetical protein